MSIWKCYLIFRKFWFVNTICVHTHTHKHTHYWYCLIENMVPADKKQNNYTSFLSFSNSLRDTKFFN
jgi:hypothetical protein